MAERLFGTDGLRGPVNIYPMTVDVALRLGLAAGVRFRKGSHQHRVPIHFSRLIVFTRNPL